MRTFWKGFFWGPPSHKRIAWHGALAGLAVLALPLIIAVFGKGGYPLFLLALVFVGLAETGWGIEILPRHIVTLAGWGRVVRWLCAVIGLAPLWFTGVIAVGALLLVFEMAPGGYANRV